MLGASQEDWQIGPSKVMKDWNGWGDRVGALGLFCPCRVEIISCGTIIVSLGCYVIEAVIFSAEPLVRRVLS